MKVNATTRGQRVSKTIAQMLGTYDTTCIVLHFGAGGVDAAVHIVSADTGRVGDEIFSVNEASPTVTEAMRRLEESVRLRVALMAELAGVKLAAPDEETA